MNQLPSDPVYRYNLYVAGVKTPLLSHSVSTRFGSLANLSVEVPYSPFVLHIHEQTKVQLWEQVIRDGVPQEPTLEFDGIIVGIIRNKNVLGNVSARLTCTTDGVLWNRRKQYDFYLDQITEADTRLTGDVINMRANGTITNFFSEVLQNNKFDIGCAVASVLTSITSGAIGKNKAGVVGTYYEYTYNGRKFFKKITGETESKENDVTPPYYKKFLVDKKLGQKLYGVSTSQSVKEFFQHDRFIKLLNNDTQDLIGENTFWMIATRIMEYGFYSIYDVPNPTFIPGKASNRADVKGKDLEELKDVEIAVPTETSPLNFSSTPTKRVFGGDLPGLAEYILKPISVLGLPLKCNIIWPEQVQGESLFYDLMQLPTRIIMQKKVIPGPEDNVVLTTQKVAGPNFENSEHSFLHSLTLRGTHNKDIREVNIQSPYEKEYGISYEQLHLSYAFDEALLSSENMKDENESISLGKKMTNFLNYEFSQRFFATRSYQIQVTPDVDVAVGLPIIILNNYGEHIIAFVTGIEKSASVSHGNKSISLSVSYPRFYYEDISSLGNVIDPTSVEELASGELAALFGTEPFVPAGSSSAHVAQTIEELFSSYRSKSIHERHELKLNHKRRVCTFNQFLSLYGETTEEKTVMPESYLQDVFKSSKEADDLSTHRFRYFNEALGIVDWFKGSNIDVVKAHNEWISEARMIGNRSDIAITTGVQGDASAPKPRSKTEAASPAPKLSNAVPEDLKPKQKQLEKAVASVQDTLQKRFGPDVKVSVNSAYRSPEKNAAVGGVKNSQHAKAEAADLKISGASTKEAFNVLAKSGIPYDQLIFEKDQAGNQWIHFSIPGEGKAPRQMAFTATKKA